MNSISKELFLLEQILDGREKPRNIKLSVLKCITDDFSHAQKIGCGGCGEVFKATLTKEVEQQGILQNRIIAVKKLFNKCNIEDKEFDREVESMMTVNHQNIVRFIGYCCNTEHEVMKLEGKFIKAEVRERLLCFEHVSNGSLDNHLTDELRGLEWYTRYKIITGICEGLYHLHNEKGIIHMDLKAANILLDHHMVPKIADFGLSRLAEISHTTSKDRLLTLGYCAPEYKYCGKMSVKSDIYSLGVIMIEIVTGSKEDPHITTTLLNIISADHVCILETLRRWKHRWNKSGQYTPLAYRQVRKCIELALDCKKIQATQRPFICDILAALSETGNLHSNELKLDQETSCLEDMIGIEPLELHFPFEPNKATSCLIHLRNNTDMYFAFSIETTNPTKYWIQPYKDVVAPRSECSITIILQAGKQASKHERYMDELSVQSTIVDEGFRAADINKFTFIGKNSKVVDNVSLTVVVDMPQSPEEPIEDFTFAALSTPTVSVGTNSQYKHGERSYKKKLVSMLNSWRRKEKAPSDEKLYIVKQEEELSSSGMLDIPKPKESPSLSEACSTMDLMAVHQILMDREYTDDQVSEEISFEEWTQQRRDMMDARKRGDFAFCEKDFDGATEYYTQAIDVGQEMASRTIYVRRSLCHIMCDQLAAALRDAMQMQRRHPDWPTALYMQAVALSKLNQQIDSMGMLSEALELEYRQKNTEGP